MATPSIQSFSPQTFSVKSAPVVITATGKNLTNTGDVVLWIQLRDASQASTVAGPIFSAATQAATSATFNLPAQSVQSDVASRVLWYTTTTSASVQPDGNSTWHSNKNFSPLLIYDLDSSIGNTIPVDGGTNCVIGLYNAPDNATASVQLIAKSVRTKAWKAGLIENQTITVDATIQVTNSNTRLGLVHFTSPPFAFEGLYTLAVTLTVVDDDSGLTLTGPFCAVPGPGIATYVPVLGSFTSKDSVTVPAMGISCSFTATSPDRSLPFVQDIPDTTKDTSVPDWVNDFDANPDTPGAGDDFDWQDNQVSLYVDGVGHKLIDESPALFTQLLELEGSGSFYNGSPVALRVWTSGKGWRCARMDTNALTYSQPGNYPTRWVVDASSKEYPSRAEEFFGIYQLVKNDKYIAGNDDANKKARAAPCIINTEIPNEIMLGIDKIILVPGAFVRPIDPFFVSPTIPAIMLKNFARPPQSLVYNDGGFVDGIKVDMTIYSVYLTGYINYALPSDVVAATVTGPSLNPAENISCTCIGSAPLKSGSSTTKYMLAIASEPSTIARPCNLFYTIYSGDGNGVPPFSSAWRPLMNFGLARAVGNGVGQVSIVQLPNSNNVLLLQSSRLEIVEVYACTVDFNALTLTISNESTLQSTGVLSLKSDTVMHSVMDMYSTRFGVQFPAEAQINLMYSSWFDVLFQPAAGSLPAGLHIFTAPYTFNSTILHLFYPMTTSDAPFIDETSGVCVGAYGSVPPSSPSTLKPPPLLQIVTGHLGSKANLVIDAVTFGGANPIYVEVKAKNSGGTQTFAVREWSSWGGNGAFIDYTANNVDAISGTKRDVTIKTLADGACTLSLHWEPTTVAGVTPTSIAAADVIDGDIWLLEVLPYTIDKLASGIANKGDASILTDVSGSHLKPNGEFSCSFTIVYGAPKSSGNSPATGPGTLTVTNSKNTGSNASTSSLIIPNGSSTLDAKGQVVLSESTANIILTLAGNPVDQDQWAFTITNGTVLPPISGISNTGDWAYPVIGGIYAGNGDANLKVACTAITNFKGSPQTISFTYSIDQGSDQTFTLTAKTSQNSANVTTLVGWTTATLSNGLTFGFENLSGTPAINDSWTFVAKPSVPVVEVMGQKPAVAFCDPSKSDSAWIIAPTQSAGGRFLQFQIPLVAEPSQPSPNLPLQTALLPLRSTLEPYLTRPASGPPTLYFKGLTMPGLSWSDGIKSEITTDQDNQRAYGLFGQLSEDYRAAHSGVLYSALFPTDGLHDTGIEGTKISTFDAGDLMTEPKLPSDLFAELPPLGWSFDPLSTDPPKYKPTAWLALFPQYLFHIGQVHVWADIASLYALGLPQVTAAMKIPVFNASGAHILGQSFFVNTLIPYANVTAYNAMKNAVGTQMTNDVQNKYLKDEKGEQVNPFSNDDFDHSVVWNPNWSTAADYPNVAKYILQLSVVRQIWDEVPSWSIATPEGRICDNYWKFRIGGPTADEFLNTALNSACYINQRNTLTNAALKQYFSTNPIFIAGFGSAAAATASILTDVRMETSLAQLSDRSRARIIDCMLQQISSNGMSMYRTVASYLATRAVMNTLTPINNNVVSDIPLDVDKPANAPTAYIPQPWEVQTERWAGPVMTLGMIAQGALKLAQVASEDAGKSFEAVINDIKATAAARRVPGSSGNRASLEPRPSTGQVRVDKKEVVQVPGENAEQIAILSDAEYRLPADLKVGLGKLKLSIGLEGANAIFSAVLGAAMVANSIAAWNQNASEGGIGLGKNIVGVVADVCIVAQFGVSIVELALKIQQLRNVESGSLQLAEKAAEVSSTLKTLETLNKVLGGLLNVAFGIQSILSGVQELQKGGSQKLDGQLDISAGALMVVGGVIELAGAASAALAIPGLGEIVAGIGMAISIIKIWVGGPQAIAAFGESIIDLFGGDGGDSQVDLTQNAIVRMKNLALLTKVSKKVTVSPDPRDNGAEAKSKLLIAPLYSVATLGDD